MRKVLYLKGSTFRPGVTEVVKHPTSFPDIPLYNFEDLGDKSSQCSKTDYIIFIIN